MKLWNKSKIFFELETTKEEKENTSFIISLMTDFPKQQ